MFESDKYYSRDEICTALDCEINDNLLEANGLIVGVGIPPEWFRQPRTLIYVSSTQQAKTQQLCSHGFQFPLFKVYAQDQWQYQGIYGILDWKQDRATIDKEMKEFSVEDTVLVFYMREEERIAIHESGHALVGRKKGQFIASFTILPDGDKMGGVTFKADDQEAQWKKTRKSMSEQQELKCLCDFPTEWLETTIMIAMAGISAEEVLLHSAKNRPDDPEPNMALIMARALALQSNPEADVLSLNNLTTSIYRTQRNLAKELIEQHRETVRTLANTVLNSPDRTLKPEIAHNIIGK